MAAQLRLEVRTASPTGWVNLLKPYGPTSHDCVAALRRALPRRTKVGHAGTLDPAATGVLPIAVGRTTKLIQFGSPRKEYAATVQLGCRTTTDDAHGRVLERKPQPDLSPELIESSLQAFTGTFMQRPPLYSAVSVDGVRLYKHARRAEREAPPADASVLPQLDKIPHREVYVSALQLVDFRDGQYPEVDIQVTCRAGFFVRSLARDLGDTLGCGGHATRIERLGSGCFKSSDGSVSLDHACDDPVGSLHAADAGLAHLRRCRMILRPGEGARVAVQRWIDRAPVKLQSLAWQEGLDILDEVYMEQQAGVSGGAAQVGKAAKDTELVRVYVSAAGSSVDHFIGVGAVVSRWKDQASVQRVVSSVTSAAWDGDASALVLS